MPVPPTPTRWMRRTEPGATLARTLPPSGRETVDSVIPEYGSKTKPVTARLSWLSVGQSIDTSRADALDAWSAADTLCPHPFDVPTTIDTLGPRPLDVPTTTDTLGPARSTRRRRPIHWARPARRADDDRYIAPPPVRRGAGDRYIARLPSRRHRSPGYTSLLPA